MMANNEVVALQDEQDVVRARQAVRTRMQELKFSLVDQTKMITAASELARNTVIHGGGGQMSIEVLVNGTRTGVRLTFEDNGPGIAANDLPHLFERFYRVDASRARRSGGSGLGLAIVQAIAEAHGGSVGVTSVAGEGATFTIVLPIAGATKATHKDTGLASA